MLDEKTTQALVSLNRRRTYYLGKGNSVEAERCLVRINAVLDKRSRPHAVAPDGEVVMSDQSDWVKAQVVEPKSTDPMPRGGVGVLDYDKSLSAADRAIIEAARKEMGL